MTPTGQVNREDGVVYALNHPADINMNTTGASIDENGSNEKDKRDRSLSIFLPNHNTAVKHISLDIGGSLIKVVYFTANPNGKGGQLHFEHFETSQIDSTLQSLAPAIGLGCNSVVATGGGAFKYYDLIKEKFNGIPLGQAEEMECLIKGATFLITQIPKEVFCWDVENQKLQESAGLVEGKQYPYLLVNVGSGVSMIKVDSANKFERIGGSSLGGGTLWGLLAMLTPSRNYDEMLDLAMDGDNRNVDMLVGDIYGSDYQKIGLKASAIASSFAKAFKQADQAEKTFNASDISRSLLYAVSNNIGQLAYLHARYHNIERIYFGGSYIRGHPQTIHTLAYAIRFWSKGEKTAYFFRHEGYLGAVGAFIAHGGDGLMVS